MRNKEVVESPGNRVFVKERAGKSKKVYLDSGKWMPHNNTSLVLRYEL